MTHALSKAISPLAFVKAFSMVRWLRIAVGIAAGLLAVGCRMTGRGPGVTHPPAYRADVMDSLLVELRRLSRGEASLPDDTSFVVARRISDVDSSLVYHWGVYAPPNSADITRIALVVVRGRQVRVVRGPGDLLAMFEAREVSRERGLQLCREAATDTAWWRGPAERGYLFESDSTLGSLIVHDRAGILRHATPPVTRVTSIGWATRFWMVEPDDLVQYDCRFTGDRLELAIVGKVRDVGIARPD